MRDESIDFQEIWLMKNGRTVRKIFDDALRQKPEERQKFVNQVCGGDKTLLAEVESLLSSHDSAESFMETPAVAKVARGLLKLKQRNSKRENVLGITK